MRGILYPGPTWLWLPGHMQGPRDIERVRESSPVSEMLWAGRVRVPLLLTSLGHVTSMVVWDPWVKLRAETRNVTLAPGCSASRYFVSEDSVVVIHSHEVNTCQIKFKPTGECSLLMRCEEFQLAEKRNSKCGKDFLLVKVKGKLKSKYCGDDSFPLQSHNFGRDLLFKLRMRTKVSQSVTCSVSCCPGNKLSKLEVSLDKDTDVAPVQSCQTQAAETDTDKQCGIPGSRIVGGQLAPRHQYTWLAMLTRAHSGKRNKVDSVLREGLKKLHLKRDLPTILKMPFPYSLTNI